MRRHGSCPPAIDAALPARPTRQWGSDLIRDVVHALHRLGADETSHTVHPLPDNLPACQGGWRTVVSPDWLRRSMILLSRDSGVFTAGCFSTGWGRGYRTHLDQVSDDQLTDGRSGWYTGPQDRDRCARREASA